MSDGFWNDSRRAKEITKKLDSLKKKSALWTQADGAVNDSEVLLQLAQQEKDDSIFDEIELTMSQAEKALKNMEVSKMLSGAIDDSGAFLQINAGAGGTESCDWVDILLRMYRRYAESKGYACEMIDFTEGDGAGYRSVTLMMTGEFAYGFLKAEIGVHRLVRISPFDANKRRHTSFASVYVYADLEDDVEIELNEADLKVDTFRAGGAGGQKVNKTDSAVRMTHLPTGIVVQCQNERSQHQNRAMAIKMMKARLYELEMQKKREEQKKIEDSKKDIAWGSQIRSYVLQPYQMVKDHRTNYETSQTGKVLDGDLDEFIRQYLLLMSS